MSKKRFQFQFSLKALLLLMFLLGVLGGAWSGIITPIRQQWRTVQPILELGGNVETTPSNLARWLKPLLPRGETDHIAAIHFNNQPITLEKIERLKTLPHLRHLYIQRTGLKAEHMEGILELSKLQLLAIGGNSLTNSDLAKLVQLEELELLGLTSSPYANWKALVAFRNHPKVEIQHDFEFAQKAYITHEEVDEYNLLNRFYKPDTITLQSVSSEDLAKIRKHYPNASAVHILLREPLDLSLFERYLQLNKENPFALRLLDPGFKNGIERKHSRHAIEEAWQKVGPHCDEIEVFETNSIRNSVLNRCVFRRSKKQDHPFAISIDLYCKTPPVWIAKLDSLPNVEAFTIKGYAFAFGELWGFASKCPNLTKLTVRAPSCRVDSEAFPPNFPEGFAFLDTLTNLSIELDITTTEEPLVEWYKKTFSKLKSFEWSAKKTQLIKPESKQADDANPNHSETQKTE